ncbi:hypothetical protein AMECASPLE_007055 [Ameca splendens]|uniref:Uncharacterized protein n=1 Tax=Ameca splendens TaxID=208324 RepID=A0ABV0XNJ8_9TELE
MQGVFCEPKGTVVTTRPSGRPVGAEDLTERAGCHLILTPELRQVRPQRKSNSGVGLEKPDQYIFIKKALSLVKTPLKLFLLALHTRSVQASSINLMHPSVDCAGHTLCRQAEPCTARDVVQQIYTAERKRV